MMPSQKVQLAIVIVGAIAATVQLWIKHRQAVELKEKEAQARKELSQEQAATQERAARHARESIEREAEREQKEKLIAQLQANTAETLAILRNELRVRDEASARSFEYLDRNTRATEKLAETALAQAAELREIRGQVAELKGGAGCRAVGTRST